MKTELQWNFENVYHYTIIWKEKIAYTGKVQRIWDKYTGTKKMFLSFFKWRLENKEIEKYKILKIKTKPAKYEEQRKLLNCVALNKHLGLEV